ncbi:MAG: hypothetical protein JXB30_16920 [Anaerolineae bacterium]|nr:hypothetical protein [Anaerolineae bacterium]
MYTVEEIIRELLDPVLGLAGEILRPLGTLGLGMVAGSVLRQAVQYKQPVRLYTPLIFLGVVALFGLLSYAPLSSPGALAMAGIGLYIGYMLLGRKAAGPAVPMVKEADEDEVASSS